MYDFPNSPTTGQIATGPGGIQWQWDGVKWVAQNGSTLAIPVTIAEGGTGATTAPAALTSLGAVPIAGGTMTGPLGGTTATFSGLVTPSGGIQGVTNGSAAAAGIVGQYMSATGGAVGMSNNVAASSGSITLTPGQWLVGGTFNMQGTGAQTYFQAGLSLTNGGALLSTASMSSTALGGNNTLTLPSVMQNVSASTTIYATGTVQYTTGSMSGTGSLWALRIR